MASYCHGLCNDLPNVRKCRGGKRLIGEKKCINCEIAIKTDNLRCPCCKLILRKKTGK